MVYSHRSALFSFVKWRLTRASSIDPGAEWPSTGTQPSVVLAPSTRRSHRHCCCRLRMTFDSGIRYEIRTMPTPVVQNTSKWHQRHKQKLRNQLKKMILWISLHRIGLFVAIPVLINKRLLPDSRCVTIYPILFVRCGYNSHDTLITISHIYR